MLANSFFGGLVCLFCCLFGGFFVRFFFLLLFGFCLFLVLFLLNCWFEMLVLELHGSSTQ